MAKFHGTFEFRSIPSRVKADRAFAVTAIAPDGVRTEVGTVTQTKIRHMNMIVGWRAEAHDARDGRRGMHPDQARAAAALMWYGQSYETLIHPI